MAITIRDLTPADAEVTAALMSRIEADHPTGFCLGVVEILEIMTNQPRTAFEGAFDGPTMVAFTTLFCSPADDDPQRFLVFGDVDPARLGEGLGTDMLTRAMHRARALHAVEAPDRGTRIATTALAGREDQVDLMRAAGLGPGRHSFFMVADLTAAPPTPPMPEDVEIAPFDPDTGEELRLAHNAAFADYPDRSDAGAEFWGSFMVTATHNRPQLTAIARDRTGAVVSYVFAHEYAVPPSGGPGPEIHVPYVGTLPAHRGRGLATGLLSRVLHASRAAGYVSASLNVDSHNPTGALGIYERAGFRQSYRQDFYRLDE